MPKEEKASTAVDIPAGNELVKAGKNGADEPKEVLQAVSFAELIRTADWIDWFLMFWGTVCAFATGAVQPCFTLIFGDLVANLTPPTTLDPNAPAVMPSFEKTLRPTILWFCYLAIGAFGAAYIEIACWEATSMRQANRIRRQYLQSLVRQDIAFFDKEDSGALLARVVSDTNAIQEALSSKLAVCLQHFGAGLVGVIIGLAKGWKMALVMLSLMPLLGTAGALFGKTIQLGQNEQAKAYAKASALAKETIGAVRVVAAFGGESRFMAAFAAACLPAEKSERRSALSGGFSVGFLWLVMFGTYALALWYGSTLIIKGEYSGGQVMIVLFSIIIAGFEVGQAAPGFSTILSGKQAAFHAFSIIDRTPAIDQGSAEGQTKDKFEGGIEFRDVRFAYPSRPAVSVLESFNLAVPAGSSMALVGQSGSGKSTVIQLLQRYYDPTAGGVFLDGTDLRQLNLRWVRQHLGLVSQEPSLFATTIGQNICYGRVGKAASAEELEAAARAANAFDFISKLPQGFDTQVGERGVQLSGGQKQRIAIARAVLRNPAVLLLDEATSALDSESERLVQSALDRLMRGRTSVVIAHRFSTIRDADCITVMIKGRVVEQGPHATLSEKEGGAYFSLLNKRGGGGGGDGGPSFASLGSLTRMDSSSELAGKGSGGDLAGKDDSAAGNPSKAALYAVDAPPAKSADGTKALAVSGKGKGGAADEAPKKGGWFGGGKADSEPKEKEPEIPFSRLFALCREKAALFPIGIVCSALVGAIMPCFALALASIIAAFLRPPAEIAPEIRKWCLIFLGIAVGSFLAGIGQMWALGTIGADLAKNARTAAFRAILRMEMGWFDREENSSGRLTMKLEEDAVYIRGSVSDQISVVAQNLTVLGVGFAIAFAYSWKLALVIIATLPALIGAASMQMIMLAGFSGADQKEFAHTKQLLSDALGNMRTVCAYGLDKQMVSLYTEAQAGPAAQQFKKASMQGAGFGLGQGIFFLLYALAFWYGGRLVDAGEIDAGAVFKCFFAVIFLGMGFGMVAVAFPNLGKAGASVKSIFAILDRPSEIDPESPNGESPDKVDGALEFRGVCFSYPSRPTVPILRGFDLVAPARKTTALVGSSGGGKSTVILLLQRFYDPTSGQVLFDGRDTKTLNLRWLRLRMGLVSQEPVLFSTSIYENILYGREGASRAEVEAAAGAANAAEFVDRLPEKYESQVGERGVQMSGGQKQRIAIARAVLRNPAVLLLDEATSALDSESERLVQAALDKLMVGRTSVVIAHRLSTIRDADQIVVVGNGVVKEVGSHDRLLASGGQYSDLFRMQHSGGADAVEPAELPTVAE